MYVHLNPKYKHSLRAILRIDLLKTIVFFAIIFVIGLSTNSDGLDISDGIIPIVLSVLVILLMNIELTDSSLLTLFGIIVVCIAVCSIPDYLSWIRFESLWLINISALSLLYIKSHKASMAFFWLSVILCVVLFLYEQVIQSHYGAPGVDLPNNSWLFNFSILFFFLIDNILRIYFLIYHQNDIVNDLNSKNKIEEQYSILFHNSFNPVLLYDYNSNRILEANDSFVKMMGYSKDELKDLNSVKLLDSEQDDINNIFQIDNVNLLNIESLGNNKLISSTGVFKNKLNESRYCDIHILPLNKESGKAYVICLDKTDELRYRQELEKSRNNYKNIFDNNLLGVVVLDSDTNILAINHSFCEMMGYTEAELLGNSILDYTTESSLEESRELIKLLQSSKIHSYIQEKSYVRKDNRVFEALISVKGIYEDGKFVKSVSTIQDITQRKEIESSLILSEEKYRDIFDNSLSGLALIKNGKYIDGNPSFYEIFNMPDGNTKGKKLLDFIHPEDVSYVEEEINSLINNPVSNKRLIYRIVIEDEVKTIMANIAINKDSESENYSAVLNCIDLTEFMDMQSQLNERQAIYEALIENSFTGIDVIELGLNMENFDAAKLLVRNKMMTKFLSAQDNDDPFISFKSLMTISPDILSNGEKASHIYKLNSEKLKSGRSIEHEWSLHKGNRIQDFNVYTQIVEVNGKFIFIRNLQNITERKKKDQIILNQLFELNKKNQELEKYIESNLQLENFAYIASHDLKAPLRTVSSFAYLLKKNSYESLNSKGKKYLDIIITSSGNMQVLIQDLLQYARINSQKVNFKTILLNQFLSRCIQDLNQDIMDNKGKVFYGVMPEKIVADEVKLRQLFQNLIRNALKFKRKGVPPVVKIECEENNKEWTFSITDNGIGIEANQKDRIFGIFTKLHSSDEFEGTGLGLTISRKIVEQHMGKIWLDSVPGQGTIFYFTILKDFLLNEIESDLLQKELNQI